MASIPSKSEDRGGKAVSIPTPSVDAEGGKKADVMNSNPQTGHGKFGAGDWDPSTHSAAPKGSGWTSRSEDRKPDMKGH